MSESGINMKVKINDKQEVEDYCKKRILSGGPLSVNDEVKYKGSCFRVKKIIPEKIELELVYTLEKNFRTLEKPTSITFNIIKYIIFGILAVLIYKLVERIL